MSVRTVRRETNRVSDLLCIVSTIDDKIYSVSSIKNNWYMSEIP